MGGKCLIFDGYGARSDEDGYRSFGILAVIEIFRSEMDFARSSVVLNSSHCSRSRAITLILI